MNETECPTPAKLGFATKRAAEGKAVLLDRHLHPYLCQCGSWHLTSRQTTAPAADLHLIEAISTLTDEEFDLLVAAELGGRATPQEAAALRSREIATRWRAALRRHVADMHAQLATKKGIDDPETKHWRAAVVKRMGFAHARSLEIRDVLALEQTSSSGEQLKQRASTAARRRLIAAHRDEYKAILAEELEKRGLTFEEDEADQEATD